MNDKPIPETAFERAGIAEGYRDAFGEWQLVPDETRRALLEALGPLAANPPEAAARTDGASYLPPDIEAGARVWGFAVQLYALRSARNWGFGDFTDLAHFVDQAAGLGAGVIGLCPLHAVFPGIPAHVSPYSPSSRIFRNPLYLDIEAIPDFAECAEAREAVAAAGFQRELQSLRDAEMVDHVGVAAHKRPLFETLYAHFRAAHLDGQEGARSERGAAFRAFQRAGGEGLARYGAFEAIAESRGYAWQDWPAELRRPDASGVAAFAAEHRDRVEFTQYLQWETARQLAAAQARCRDRSMPVGLMHDLAVGFDGSGADAWTMQDLMCRGMSIGAPPDLLSPEGQDWGFPPFNPFALAAAGLKPFYETLRANMTHGGGLRIDHVLGFARQYWVPAGNKATHGGYLNFPTEAMVTAIAEESRRTSTLVVGEDLGTVPEGFRERLGEARLLSYRLAYFERDWQGCLPPPEDFPRHALVASGTHDLAPLAGYWRDRDTDLRRQLGLILTQEVEDKMREDRARDRETIWRAVTAAGLIPDAGPETPVPEAATPELATAIYTYLARAPSCLLMVQPEDLLGVEQMINLPGTVDQHPNWRRKTAFTVEAFAADPHIAEPCALIDATRRGPY